MILRGKKIILRPIEIPDAEQTLKFHQDLKGMSDMAGFILPVNMENEKYWINNLYPQNKRSSIYFGICEKNNRERLVGYLSVKNINQIDRTAEFGIYIEKESRKKGFAKDSITVFIAYLFFEINLRKITLFVLEENKSAIKLYKSMGFVQEGLMRDQCWKNGNYMDLLIMSKFMENVQEDKSK